MLVAVSVLAALVWALDAHALDNPPSPTPPPAPVVITDVGTLCVPLPTGQTLCEPRTVWAQIVTTAHAQAVQAQLDAQITPSIGHWIAIGHCEEPGGGWNGIDWTADGYTRDGHFSGGLGISTQAWSENSAGLPSSALAASPLQQMIVASRIYGRFGAGAWACKA